MRTRFDWHDLPPVPRRAVNKIPTPVANQSCHLNSSLTKSENKARRKRTRFSDLCESRENHVDGQIVVPRKRPRPSSDNDAHADEDSCPEHVPMQTESARSSQSNDCVSKSTTHISDRSSKLLVSSPVSDSNTTFDDSDDDSSGGEAVRRVTLHPRSRVETSLSGNSVSRSTSLAGGASCNHLVPTQMKDSSKTSRETDNDSSDEEAVLRVIRRQHSHIKTPRLGNTVSQNTKSAPNASFENLLSSPVNVSSTAPCDEAEDSSEEEVIRRPPRRRSRPVKTSHSTNCVPQSTSPVSNASSKDFDTDPVSCSGKKPYDEADDSSDEETVSRGTRRRRRPKGTFSSGNDDGQARSISLTSAREYRSCSSNDYEGHSVSPRESRKKRRSSSPSDNKRAKRRRASLSLESNCRKQHNCRESSGLKSASMSMEALPQDSSCDTKPDMRPKKTCAYRAQRRRCGRQSTTQSVRVPWYMLDEERMPYRLRSSSRNCAARCIFWTKTERRLFKVAKSPIHNRGLYALEDIPAFAPVIEYAGEVVTQVQSEIREWDYQSRHMDEVYMYQLRKGTTDVIDGTKRGGPAKFVNHSCEPNVVADEIQAGGTNRVWFFSLRPIRKHEEILVDYCLSYEPGDIKQPCMCGARKCKKYLNYYGLTE